MTATVFFTKTFTEDSFLAGLTFASSLSFSDTESAMTWMHVMQDNAQQRRIIRGVAGSSDYRVAPGSVYIA